MPQPRRFVLLEHRWEGVHYDLMLEADGVLKTWKLAAPPAAGEQPAEVSFDHRLAYLDHEGPVSGGRGDVRRLDRGTYLGELNAEGFDVRLLGERFRGHLRLEAGEAAWTLHWLPEA